MQAPDHETLTNIGSSIGWLLAAGLSGLVMYWRTRPAKPIEQNPVLTGIGMELGNKEQTERLIAQVERCADSLEVLADRRTAEIDDKMDDFRSLLARLLEKERN